MFADDVDLVRLEPGLFSQAAWSGQRWFTGTASITSGLLSLTSAGDLTSRGIGPGWVVLVAGVPYEVLAVVSATQLAISRVREPGAAPIVPLDQPSSAIEVISFRPQIGIVHRQVLRSLGIEPDGPLVEGDLGASAVQNPDGLRLLVALGALHLIFRAAAALAPGGSPLTMRADFYAIRFSDERMRVVARLDTDGDGVADATRRPSVATLVRA
jgi:hypothetical protein